MNQRHLTCTLLALLHIVFPGSGVTQALPHPWQYQPAWLQAPQFAELQQKLMRGLNHSFVVPREQLLRATVYVGPNTRLRKVMHQVLYPTPVEAAAAAADYTASHNSSSSSSSSSSAAYKAAARQRKALTTQQQQHVDSSATPAAGTGSTTVDGRPVLRVGVLGGSISWGHGASERGVTDWFSRVTRWLADSFPGVTVVPRNGCVPASPASLMTMCLEQHMDADVDIVIVEYALNDGIEDTLLNNARVRVYERLVRRILSTGAGPALVLLQVHGHGMLTPVPPFPIGSGAGNTTGTSNASSSAEHSSNVVEDTSSNSSSSSSGRSLLVNPSADASLLNWLPRRLSQQAATQQQHQQHQRNPGQRHSHRPVSAAPFHHTMAELYGAVAQYYDTPWLSFRNAVYRLGQGPLHNDFRPFLLPDYLHPNDLGHQIMADMVIWLLLQTALGFADWPLQTSGPAIVTGAAGRRPSSGATQDRQQAVLLPRPMYPGNHHGGHRMCFLQQDFRSTVTSALGWVYANDGTAAKPKWGYVATIPGAVMKVQVDLRAVPPEGTTADQATVMFTYLKSYQHMGVAQFRCVEGCTCTDLEVDAHQDYSVSVLHLALLYVAPPHATCTISIRLSDKTSSGEHKFRVSGVIVNKHVQDIATQDYDATYPLHGMDNE